MIGSAERVYRYAARFVQKIKLAIMACFEPFISKIYGESRDSRLLAKPLSNVARMYDTRVRLSTIASGRARLSIIALNFRMCTVTCGSPA